MGSNLLLAMKEHFNFSFIQRAEEKCIKLLCYSLLGTMWNTEDYILLPPQWDAISYSDGKNSFQMIYGYNSGKAASGRKNALFNEAVMCLIPLPN